MPDASFQSIAFIDFEASSLSEDSWPIEVGLSWITADESIRTLAWRIRREPIWSEIDWSSAAERVHGISLASLKTAPIAADVAHCLAIAAEGRTVASDAPKYDGYWLERLFHAGAGSAFPLINFHSATFSKFSEQALDWIYEELHRTNAPHRAGPDSARLARAWRKGLQIEAKRSSR